MRLLILSFYYSPDLSAGSFRTTALVKALRERAPSGSAIDVVTTAPNRYVSFSHEAEHTETTAGVAIRRIALPPHHSDIRGQSRAFAAFARGAIVAVAGHEYDVVYATSSRLMTATLGAWIARRTHARLYLDIRDIFVETIAQVLPPVAAHIARSLFAPLESWTIGRADRVNLVSPGFEPYFRSRYGERLFLPVLKIATNSEMAALMAEHIDIDAGTILTGRATVDDVGQQIYDAVLRAADGELTGSERGRHREFAIPKRWSSL